MGVGGQVEKTQGVALMERVLFHLGFLSFYNNSARLESVLSPYLAKNCYDSITLAFYCR